MSAPGELPSDSALYVICAYCGAPCSWVHVDRIRFGRTVFTERQLVCSGCERADPKTAYFPWPKTRAQAEPISVIELCAADGSPDLANGPA